MRVVQIVAAFEAAGMAIAGPVGRGHRHRHLHHLHHRSLNQTGLNTTDAGESTTVYADHIKVVTSTLDTTPVAVLNETVEQENLASSAVTADFSATISETLSLSSSISLSSSTLSLSSSTLSLSSSSLVSSAPSLNAPTPDITPTSSSVSTAPPLDSASSSVSVVIVGPSSTPTAVGVLSQTIDTTTLVSVETVFNTVTSNGIVTTHSASEKTKTVEDVVTNYVTATFSALTPFKNPVIKIAAAMASSSCSVKTRTVTLPASKSPTLVAGGKTSSSVKPAVTSKVSSVKAVVASSKKASTSSKKSSTSSKKPSTSSKKLSTSSKKANTSSKKVSSSTKKVSSSTKKATTSSRKVSSSSKKVSSSSKKSSTMKTTASVKYSTFKSSTKAGSSAKPSSSKCAAVAAPAPTQSGVVSGCTKWYTAKSGDYCYKIASQYSISADTFMAWNPAVNAPSCNNIQIGNAYCVATCSTGGSSASTLTSTGTTSRSTQSSSVPTSQSGPSSTSTSSGSSPTVAPSSNYKFYSGNGTEAAGWPSQDQWLDFETLFAMNKNIMTQSCANNNWGPNNSPSEIANIKTAIISIAEQYAIDARFVLAIIMQESNGCVRVITTNYGVRNPGLMQDHNGAGTCNDNGVVQTPCPYSEIEQMVRDGTAGTTSGDGLVQCLAQTASEDVSKYYRAARIYNGGYGGYRADDLGAGCCTLCYSSDVANRLTGWSAGTSGCSL